MFRAGMLLLALTFAPSVALAQQPCTPDARQVVNELYRHILERQADAGSAVWVQHLERGGTVRDVVRSIAKSDEHQQRFWRPEAGEEVPYIRAVGTIYRHLLGRQPDAAGARSWATQASRSGMDSIVDQIINSAEYNQQFGDWGVPGSGGLRYCGPNNQGANQPARQAPVAATPVAQRRFRVMDRNNDGVISRAEWRGSRQSFDVHDWNNDGVLNGAEVDEAVARQGRTVEDENFDRVDQFENLDVNNNNRIEAREWHGTVAAWNRLDVNNDNFLTRAEFTGTGVNDTAVATSGNFIRVEGARPWTDTGIAVRAGDNITFDAQGTVRISNSRNDIAGAGGTLSGRREANAPLPNQVAGALIARIGNSPPLFIGNRRAVRAPFSGRLYLGVNDDYLEDNSGDFQVTVVVEPR
jgi:Ca2+-binding EF-hand superfamily protein